MKQECDSALGNLQLFTRAFMNFFWFTMIINLTKNLYPTAEGVIRESTSYVATFLFR